MNAQFVIIGNLFIVNVLRLRRWQHNSKNSLVVVEEHKEKTTTPTSRMASDPLWIIVSSDYQNSSILYLSPYNFPFHGSRVARPWLPVSSKGERRERMKKIFVFSYANFDSCCQGFPHKIFSRGEAQKVTRIRDYKDWVVRLFDCSRFIVATFS